jgi:hypothetical protein
MSNISKTIDYLREMPENRFINIINQETNARVGKEKIYLKDIPNEDLESFIKFQIGPASMSKLFWVEIRQNQGATHVKKASYPVEIMPNTVEQKKGLEPIPATIIEKNEREILGSQNSNFFGLGFVDVMNMHSDSKMLQEKTKQVDDLREDIKNILHEKKLLEIELRKALTDVSMAQSKEALAVMIAKAENKSFFDGDNFQKLIEKVPEVMEKLAIMKGNIKEVQESGVLGGVDLTPIQKEALLWMGENLNDQQIVFIGRICALINNQDFVNEINQLIQKFSENGN